MSETMKKAAGMFAARESKEVIDEGLGFAPKFDADGLIPAMAVDADTGVPLMQAYMNEESLRLTLAARQAVYWSRSRKEIWHKGLTSGEFQDVEEILVDCDQDALVLRVRQRGGGCCHTKRATCFYRRIKLDDLDEAIRLEKV
jgi:phosphoribosyl-AMP cyclohydrolase